MTLKNKQKNWLPQYRLSQCFVFSALKTGSKEDPKKPVNGSVSLTFCMCLQKKMVYKISSVLCLHRCTNAEKHCKRQNLRMSWYTQHHMTVGRAKSGKSLFPVRAAPAAERREYLYSGCALYIHRTKHENCITIWRRLAKNNYLFFKSFAVLVWNLFWNSLSRISSGIGIVAASSSTTDWVDTIATCQWDRQSCVLWRAMNLLTACFSNTQLLVPLFPGWGGSLLTPIERRLLQWWFRQSIEATKPLNNFLTRKHQKWCLGVCEDSNTLFALIQRSQPSLNMSQHSATTWKKAMRMRFERPMLRCNQSSGVVAKSHFSSKGMDSSAKLLRHKGHLPWAKIWNNRSRWINRCLDCIAAKLQYWLDWPIKKIAERRPALHLCLVHYVADSSLFQDDSSELRGCSFSAQDRWTKCWQTFQQH